MFNFIKQSNENLVYNEKNYENSTSQNKNTNHRAKKEG